MSTRSIGDFFENIAAQYLQNLGYVILEQNFFCRYGEIDIIARKDSQIVFVEVKSLASGNGFYLEETISKRKLQRIYLAINRWVFEHKVGSNWRLDFIGIEQKDSKCLLNHWNGVELY